MRTDEEIVAAESGRPVRYCRNCCERPVDLNIAYMSGDILLCFQCAERIANFYYKRCSGRWLTYENKPVERKEKQKKKISHKLQKMVFERDAYRCKHCGTHIDLTVDHIKPESKGGTLDLDNLQTLCRSCNSKKGVR